MIANEYAHLIEIDNCPYIKDTRYKVQDIALNYLAYGWSPDEMHRQHPDLTKAKICSAMAYYYDNQEDLDQQILDEEEEIKKLRSQSSQLTRQELLARLGK